MMQEMPLKIVNINGIVMPIERFINETLEDEGIYGVDWDNVDERIKRLVVITHDIAYMKGYSDGRADGYEEGVEDALG
jgi:hypothetical protein